MRSDELARYPEWTDQTESTSFRRYETVLDDHVYQLSHSRNYNGLPRILLQRMHCREYDWMIWNWTVILDQPGFSKKLKHIRKHLESYLVLSAL